MTRQCEAKQKKIENLLGAIALYPVAMNSKEQSSLKSLREKANLTQPELSRRMNVGIRIIGDWERGESIPRLDRAVALARELEVS